MGEVPGKFNRESALLYCKLNNITDVSGDMKDKAIERIVREWVEAKCGKDPYECPPEEGGCGAAVQEQDTFCWRCAHDVDDDVKDAFEKAKKKGGVVDKTAENQPGGKEPEPAKKPADKGEKKPAKKPADKGEKKPSKKPADKGEKKPVKKSKAPAAVSGTLEEHLDKVRTLTSDTGRNAWRVGMHLNAIRDGGLHTEKGYPDFKSFLAAELPNLPYSTANGFMKAAREFEEDEAALLGSKKMMILKNVSAAARPPLLKAAMPKERGGKGITAEKLKEEVSKVREKTAGKRKKAGRPTESPFTKFLGQSFRAAYDDADKDICTIPLDEPDVNKRVVALVHVQERGVKLEFVPDPSMEDD